MAIASQRAPDESSDATRVTLVHSSGVSNGQRTSHMLRARLRIIALLILFAELLWLARAPFLEPPTYAGLQIASLVTLGALAAVLWSQIALERSRLRVLEGLIFGLTTIRLVAHSYLLLRDRATAGDQLAAQAEMYNIVIAIGALIVVYGMLVPNVWQRAAVITTVMATAPPLGIVALRQIEPSAYAVIADTVRVGLISDLLLALVVSVLVATAGTEIIYSLQRQAIAARDLGQYQLQERIAVGGMGEIWRASHRFLARPAAVKVIHPEKIDPLDPAAAAQILERFEREAQATASLESIHTVRIYDFGRTAQGDFYYAMELLVGLDLETLVTRFGPLPPERVIHFLVQVCDSLAEAHELGQVHRDIKPSNLFVCQVGRAFDVIKVLDFGLVTRAGSERARDLRLVDEEAWAGTPAYMAPEQVLAETTIDERADLYALGCVGYWLLTGHTVFDIERPIAMAVAHVKAPPMPPSRRTELPIPKDLEQLILRCLAKDPAARPPSAEALSDALAACVHGERWNEQRAREWWQTHQPLEAGSQASPVSP